MVSQFWSPAPATEWDPGLAHSQAPSHRQPGSWLCREHYSRGQAGKNDVVQATAQLQLPGWGWGGKFLDPQRESKAGLAVSWSVPRSQFKSLPPPPQQLSHQALQGFLSPPSPHHRYCCPGRKVLQRRQEGRAAQTSEGTISSCVQQQLAQKVAWGRARL